MYKIYYLDDEKDSLVNAITQKLETGGKLKIEWVKPTTFEDVLQNFEKSLKEYNGIFLDLKLDGEQEDGTKVKYQAPPLAQMIRTMATEGVTPDLPIFLCSTEDKINQSYTKDFTSHDLFDWTFIKDEINQQTISKISAIIEGYEIIRNYINDFDRLLDRVYSDIDPRILSRFVNENEPPVHEISRYIFKGIVKPNGVLVNEETLAARLGVDMSNSPDWAKLRDDIFKRARYSGVFSSSWLRWWNDLTLDVFEELTGQNLGSLPAEERVQCLIKATQLVNLVAAKPLEFCSSSYFWNICEITRKPIDPFEAYKIDNKIEPKPWQDYSYVSLLGMVKSPDVAEKKGIKIYPSQVENFDNARRQVG